MSRLSDRTGKRALVAAVGLIVSGGLLLPVVHGGAAKLALVTLPLGYYAASFTPNVWSILQASIDPRAIGPASGLMNGIGAGGGGTIAGVLVGLLEGATGSFTPGFMVLGALVVLGGLALLAYARLTLRPPGAPTGVAA